MEQSPREEDWEVSSWEGLVIKVLSDASVLSVAKCLLGLHSTAAVLQNSDRLPRKRKPLLERLPHLFNNLDAKV